MKRIKRFFSHGKGEESKNAARIFTEQSSNLLERLEVLERHLHERIASHIPRDLDSLEHLVLQHKDWESNLHALNSDVEEVQNTFRGIALKTPAMKKNLDKVIGKWNDLQSKSQLFVERLKFVEMVVTSMEENHQSVTEFEIKLAQFHDLPNDLELLKDMHEDLLRMQVAVSKQQIQIDQMNDDAENCRRLVESTRAGLPHTSLPRSGKHIDLERLDKEISQINNRWNSVCSQLAERLRSCEAAYQLLRNYNAGLEKEAEWIDESFTKLQSQPPIEVRPKEQFEPTRTLLTNVVERTPKIEKVNVDGGRYIREAKIYSSRCQRYAEWLCDDIHPSLDMKHIKRQSEVDLMEKLRKRGVTVDPEKLPTGSEAVARELDELNANHQRLLDLLYERLRRIAAANPGDIVTLRLVEAMAPRSARSFRQEFNMQDLATTTEHTYTTSYTSEKYVRTSHSTELDGHSPLKSMANGKLGSPNYTKTALGDDDRPDLRNLKRVHKMYEGPNIIESKGIIHPETKEILTVGQAISMRILDVRTGRLLSSPETRQTMTLEQAAKEGLIDPKLAARLTGPCGVTEDGNEVTLLEAIQRELYDAEQGMTDPAEKRIKVTVDGSKPGQGMSISDALNEGQVDLQRGLYRLPNGTYISIAEAYQKGYLIYNEVIKIKSSALSLSDAISQDLVDNTGWILDRNSGDRFQLDVAIKNELINPEIREVVDPKNDTKITLAQAIQKGIINTKTSKYIHNITKEKMSFRDAASKRFICKPMTLKDVCDNNLMTNDGKILSPTNKRPLNILEAISFGVLDSDNVKCITDTTTGQLLTLSEALGARIISADDNKFRDNLTGEICTIPEAVDRGLITSVSQRSIFNIDGFRDPKTGEFVSFNVAMSRGNLKYVNGETFLKSESGDFVYLEDCTKVAIIRAEVLEMFNRKIGIYENGKELSVLDAVFKNVLDPKTGHLLDAQTKKPIPFNKAVEINMITPEGAALLNSLLNITLTLQTVTKTVKRYVTVTNKNAQRSETIITFAEAVKRGLIDETTQTFTDPTTGTIFPIQQALDEGLIGVEKDDPRVVHISDRGAKKELVPGQVVELKITKKSFIKDLPPSPESKVQFDSRPETVKSPDYATRETSLPREALFKEIKTVTSKSIVTEPSVTSMTIKKNTIELPRGGWTLKDAIQQGLFDPVSGMFTIPGTDRILDLEEALRLNIINPDSATVIDPKTKREIPLSKALDIKVIDNTGHYKHPAETLTMKVAIERKYILFTQTTISTATHKVITITSVAGMPDKMEISEVQSRRGSPIDEQTALEPVQVAQGVIYDPATALVISTTSGVSENIVEAVDRGVVPSDTVKVIEPHTGKQITLQQAIHKGIIDKRTGDYVDRMKRISLADAAKVGLVAVVGAPIVAASKVIQIVKSTMVVDPKTGEKLPMEVAYERGLVDPATYKQYEDSIRDRTPDTDLIQAEKSKPGTSTVSVTQVTKPVSVGAAVSEGFITVESIQNSLSADNRKVIDAAPSTKTKHPVEVVQITKSQATKKPKYKVNVAKESTIESQVLETKPIVLQKLRKRVVLPLEAIEKGLVDKETVKILEAVKVYKDEKGEPMTLEKAIEKGLIDSNKGKIVDPIHGDVVNIKEAINRGILDPEGQDEVLVPLAKSLAIPEVLEQGLLDPVTGKIIHPETGNLLTLREAIICDIVDPLSTITIAPGKNITLAEAIEKDIIDNDKNVIKSSDGPVNLVTAVNAQIFPEPKPTKSIEEIPPAAMTLAVAIKRKVIDPKTGEIKHPLTGEVLPVQDAVKKDLIMAIPYPQTPETIMLEEALEKGAVNLKDGTFTDPTTKDVVPLDKAMEQGLLAVKPNSEIMQASGVVTTITETFTSQHTITTKMIELLADYVLVSANEVRNTKTGEIISIDEAREKGIVRDEQTSKEQFITSDTNISFEDALNLGYINIAEGTFTHPNTGETITISEAVSTGVLNTEVPKESSKPSPKKETEMLDLNEAFDLLFDERTQKFKDPKAPNKTLTFKEALQKNIINPDSVIYNVEKGQPVTLKDAVESGLIDKKTGKLKEPKTGKTVDIKNAAKLGLIAIVAAPVLAGAAAVQGVKAVTSKIMKPKEEQASKTPSKVILPDKVTKAESVEVTESKAAPAVPPVPPKREKAKKVEEKLQESSKQHSPEPSESRSVVQKVVTETVVAKEIKQESPEKVVPKPPPREKTPDKKLKEPVSKDTAKDKQSGEKEKPCKVSDVADKEKLPAKVFAEEKPKMDIKEKITIETVTSQEPKKPSVTQTEPESLRSKPKDKQVSKDEIIEHKPTVQEFRKLTPDGEEITTITKTVVSTTEPSEFVTEHSSTVVTSTTTTTQSGVTEYYVTEQDGGYYVTEQDAGKPSNKSSETVEHDQPIIEEYRHTTPEGEEVTTVVKTIVSHSEPSENVTEHSSTSTVVTKTSKVTTVEYTQNESTSYQMVTEEVTLPQDSTETTTQTYTVEYSKSPDQVDKAQVHPVDKVSPAEKDNKTPKDQKTVKELPLGKETTPTREHILSPESIKDKSPPRTDAIAPKQKTPDTAERKEETIPIEVAPGVIYDPNTSVVMSTTSGVTGDVLEAINKGVVPADSVKVTDPKTGKPITMKEAIAKGIIDKKTGQVKDKSGKKISFADAAKFGLVAIVGAPILAAAKVVEVVKNAVVTDPKTGEKVPLDTARERGLIDPETYKKFEAVVKQQSPKESSPEVSSTTSKTVTTDQVVVHYTTTTTTTGPSEVVITEITELEPEQKAFAVDEKKQKPSGVDAKTVSAMLIDAERQPLKAIEEMTAQNITKEKSAPVQVLYENIPILDAINHGYIEPKVCRIIINGVESPLTVQDSIEQEQISKFAPVDVVSKNLVIVRESQPKYSIAINQTLTAEELSELGVYDIEKQTFLNPETGAKITFEELVYGLRIFDPESILVKDLGSKSDNYITFEEAIARPIIEKTTGHMVNHKTGKRVPFLECVQLGWIVEKPEDVSVTEQVSIESALEQGLYNPKTGEILDSNTGALVPIGTAVEKGIVDQESLLIKVPGTNESIPVSDALERGIITIHEGVITIVETREIIEISVAIQRGTITIIRRPISIAAVIKQDMYEPKSGKIKDQITEQLISVEDAIDRNIVHPTISEIKDTASEKFVPLSEALERKLVNPETGKLKDKKTGKDIPLDDALKKGLVATKDVTFTLFDVIELGYYSPDTCKILDPKTGETVTLQKAIQSKLVDPSDVKIKDDASEALVPFDKAVKSGLVDTGKGILTSPVCNLKEASDKGYLLSDKKPWTLQEGLVQGVYDPETGKLTINGVTMTLEEAIKAGNINPDALTVRNSVTGEIITLADAIKVGIIDSKEGVVRDPIQGDKIPLTDASERGLIVPAKRKLSLPEAVFKGFYDPKTGKFSHPQSKEKVPTDRAIRKRMLDPQSTLVHIGGKVIPFEFAVDKGIVDGRTGAIMLGDERVDFREAFERGILVEVRKPLSLIEAIEKGVYNEITGLFMDPQSGKKYTLAEAIKMNLVDPHSVHITDNRLGKWDKITLPESIETGVLDDQSGRIRNINNENEEISLRKAFEIGLLVDSKAPISLQRALHQGLYDDTTGKIIDPATNRKITLHEALRRSIISPKYLCYFDKKSEKPLTLAECCRSEIIDRRSGKFHEPGSDVQIPLSEAMSLGLIVDIESAGFTLYDALAMDMYDITELAFVHPVNERRLSLKSAITEELIHPENSLVKHIPSSKYIKLDEALKTGIVNADNSVYVLPNGNQINLLDAKHRGLIVTTKKNLSLEEIIRNGLFRADNGKIVDPNTNEFVDLNKAIEIGLLNPDSTAVKDSSTNKFKPLSNAIQQGDVDVTKGRVLDTKAKKTYSLDIAFDKGLLVTVLTPITSQTIAKRYVPDSSASKEPVLREFTLDEAIKYEFIDPESALIKDPRKNKYIPLKLGMTEGIIDKNAKGSFDTQRAKTLCFLFENGLIVYVREPMTFEQAIEGGHLNITTARFTDPHSNEVITIKDATTLGHIDPDTALIKDNLKKRLVKLPEAFRKGLMDSDKGNVLDTETSKLHTLSAAIESGLLMTPKKSFTLIEVINFGIYNPTTGALNDPFITTSVMDRKRLNLGEAVSQGIVDASSTVVKEPETGKILPLVQAMEQKLVDPVEGRLTIDPVKKISLDLVKAHKKGYLLPAETRQAVEEKYRLCDETLSKLLEWIAVVEERLANQEAVKEDLDELRNQINILKLIKDDLESHQRQVSACADQAKQLLVSGGDVLAPHEVAALERGVRQLKQRVDKCTEKCDKMLRRLAAARDELNKFGNEINTFNTWMEGAYRTLEDKEAALSKLTSLGKQDDSIREFVSDVIAHQADLRFISMSAQKFVDESKEFLSILNEYRTSLPSRLSHITPPPESAVREAATLAKRRHAELAARAQRLQERLRGAADVTKQYNDALDRATRWMKEIEPQVRAVLSEPVGGEPRAVESQLNKAKSLHNEILSQGRLIDNAKDACDQLVKSLEGNLTPSEIRQLEVPVLDLSNRYQDLSGAVGSRCAELEAALLQCQGLQDAAETQANWLGQAESVFKNQAKPASLIRERLEEQVREHRIAHSEVEARRPTLAKLLSSARDAALNPSNARIAKKLEQRAEDIYARYEKLLERSIKRAQFLDEVAAELMQFTQQATKLESAAAQLNDADLSRLPADELRARLSDLAHFRDKQMPLLEECLRNGKALISKKDVTDTHVVRDRMKALENVWRDFNTSLEEKQKLSKQRADQRDQYETLKIQNVWRDFNTSLEEKQKLSKQRADQRDQYETLKIQNVWRDFNTSLEEKQKLSKQRADQRDQYETLKIQVLDWLQSMENRVGRLQPVAVDLEIVKQQQDELRPLAKEYRDFSITIDKVNEAGAIYEALTRGERADSPHRKRQLYSPTKRQTPIRSLDGRSPSPTKGHGLVSPGSTHSTSSGFSSRRSSQDGFHLEELSPVQQQLSEINNRYSLIGTKLSDRQSELDSIKEEIRRHLDSFRSLNTFLDKIGTKLSDRQSELDSIKEEIRRHLDSFRSLNTFLDKIGTKLSDRQSELDSIKEEIRRHLDSFRSLNTFLDKIGTKLSDRQSELDSIKEEIRRHLDSFRSLNTFLDKVQTLESVCTLKISLIGTKLSDRQSELDSIKEEIRRHLDSFRSLNTFLDKPSYSVIGTKLSDRQSELDSIKEEIRRHLDSFRSLNTFLDKIGTKLSDRQSELDSIKEEIRRHLDSFRSLNTFLDKVQTLESVCTLKISLIGTKLSDRQSELDSIKEEIRRHLDSFRSLNTFLDKLPLPQHLLGQGTVFIINNRYSLIGTKLSDRQSELDSIKEEIRRHLDSFRSLNTFLDKPSYSVIGTKLSDRQSELDSIKEEIRRHLDSFRSLNTFLDKIGTKLSDRQSELDSIKEEIRRHLDSFRSLNTFLDKVQTLESVCTLKISLIGTKLSDRQSELDSIKEEIRRHLDSFRSLNTFLDKLPLPQHLLGQGTVFIINNRYSLIGTKLSDRQSELDSIKEEIRRHLDSFRSLNTFLDKPSYSWIGTKLSDRQSELDSIKEEIRRHLDSFRSLNTFFDKVQRQLPKDSLANTKEEADKTIKAARQVLEEMYEKQSILDSTKTQVRHQSNTKEEADKTIKAARQVLEEMYEKQSILDSTKTQVRHQSNTKEEADKTIKAARQVLEEMYEKQSILDSTKTQVRHQSNTKEEADKTIKAARQVLEEMYEKQSILDSTKTQVRHQSNTKEEADKTIKAARQVLEEMYEKQSILDSTKTQVRHQSNTKEEADKTIKAARQVLEEMYEKQSILDSTKTQVRHQSNTKEEADKTIKAARQVLEEMYEKQSILDSTKTQVRHQSNTKEEADKTIKAARQVLEEMYEKQSILDSTKTQVRHQSNTKEEADKTIKAARQVLEEMYEKQSILDSTKTQVRHQSNTKEEADKTIKAARQVLEEMYEKQSILDSTKTQVRHQSNTKEEADKTIKAARQVLEEMYEKQSILDSTKTQVRHQSNTKEEADKTIKAARQVLEEMYEKQSILDSTKTQVRELLKRKQGVAGADRLHSEMEDVASRWKALHDAFKDRIRLMEELKDFHDTHSNLSGWLNSKERMMTALGPISSDSRMVQTQVQQVQVLREEFRTQQPQLSHLEEVASGILARLDPRDPDHSKLVQKVKALQDRWNDLLNKLEQRAESLGAAADTSREFDAGLARLRDALQTISDKLDDVALEKEPDEQLRKIENLERQLEGQRPLLADLESAGAALCDVLSDPASRQDIQSKLGAVARQYDTLQRKLDLRKAEIEAALKDGRNLEEQVARTLGWLQSELGALPGRLQVSADRHKLQQQLDKHEPLYRDLTQREHEIIMLLDKGREMEKKPAHSGLRKELDRIQTQWDKLKRETVDRQTRLQTAMEHCRKFSKAQESFLPWLSDAEDRLSKLPPTAFTKKEVEKQLRELQHIRNDIWKRSGEYENNKTLGETFISACDVDQEIVRKQLDTMKERWDRLNNACDVDQEIVRKQLDTMKERWDRLNNACDVDQETVRKQLDTMKERWDRLNNACDVDQEIVRKQLDTMKERWDRLNNACDVDQDIVRKQLDTMKERWDRLNNACDVDQEIVRKQLDTMKERWDRLNNACDVDQEIVRKQLDTMKERWDRLNNEVFQQVEFLESTARKLGDFAERVRAVDTPLTRCEERLQDALSAPPAQAAEAVARLTDQIHALRAPLQSINSAVDDIVTLAQECAGPDTASRARHVLEETAQALGDRVNDLEDRANEAKGRLAGAAAAMTQFQEKVKSLSHDLSELEKELDAMKPPGRDIKTVKQQLDDIGRFYKRLEKAEDLIGDTERAAELLADSGHSVDSGKTRDQVEGLRKQLGKLDERARSKEQDLDDTLSKLEAFYKAYDSVMDDVQEAGEQVRSLKPVSSEVEQIRAQQKDFAELKRRTLEPLGQNVAHCNKIGQGLVRSALQGVSTQQLEKDLEKMNDKWNALKEKTNERERRLDVGLLQSGKFAEALAGLEKWLADTEDMVNNQKPPSADYKVVKAQLQEQKFLKKMLMDRQNSMSSLFAMGNEVAAGCEPGERKAIEKQLKGLMQRFDALTNGAQQRMLDLEQAMKVGEREAIEKQLKGLMQRFDALTNGAQQRMLDLEQAMKRFDALTNGAQQRMLDLEQAMKYNSKPGERKVVKKQLKGLMQRYDALTNGAQQRMLNLEQAMKPGERKAIEKQLKGLMQKFDALTNEAQQRMLDLEQAMKRFDALTNGAQQRMLDLEQAMKVAKQFQEQLQPLVEWLGTTERKVKNLELAIHDDILSKQPAFKQLTETASTLMALVGDDEAANLADRLQAATDRWDQITSSSRRQPPRSWRWSETTRLPTWLTGYKPPLTGTPTVLQMGSDNKQLTETASTLMALVGDDEAANLADRLQAATDRWDQITSSSRRQPPRSWRSWETTRLPTWLTGYKPPLTGTPTVLQMGSDNKQLTETASTLMALVGDDEAANLADRLQAATDRWDQITSSSRRQPPRSWRSLETTRLPTWLTGYKPPLTGTPTVLQMGSDNKQLTETASTLMALVGDDEAANLADRLQAATDRYTNCSTDGIR
ncbi:spectrin repeat domain-containing protein [Phthorimaea operculella]|nr:spectrin repeat domain-containing protein [Phthorimaea operculella]